MRLLLVVMVPVVVRVVAVVEAGVAMIGLPDMRIPECAYLKYVFMAGEDDYPVRSTIR